MKRRVAWLIGGGLSLTLWLTVWPARAAGIDDFQLAKAIPADAMLVVHSRDHDGKNFLNERYRRVWAEVEKQRFDRDLKRLLQNAVKEQGGDLPAFEQRWQQITDLAAGVEWSRLCEQEMAFAFKLALPLGSEWVVLCKPPRERIEEDFEGLAAILKAISELAEQGQLELTRTGEGESVVHRLTARGSVVPFALTLARHQDVLLAGYGLSMSNQTLALLRGETQGASATLCTTERFKQAFKRLPPPADSLIFVDVAKLTAQARAFVGMAAKTAAPPPLDEDLLAPTTQSLAFLPPLVEAIDIWDYIAAVESTTGMKTAKESVTVFRDDAKAKPLFKALYGNPPLRDPLKYVPKQATGVSAGSGLDFQTLYKAIMDFVRDQVPQGKELIAQWEEKKLELPFDIEEDLLSWIGGGYTKFSAPIPTPFMPGTVVILGVRDEAKAAAALERAAEWLNMIFGQQSAVVEDARIEGVEGFKRVILPPQLMMFPGLGRPVFGLKDGRLILANGPEVLAAALKAAAGEAERFDKNERFLKEGLPLAPNATGFSFQDLTNWGNELSQMFSLAGLIPMFAPEIAKNPAASSAIFLITKLSNVVKKLDFYLSECSLTTMDGNVVHSKTVVNYQEPPKPKAVEKETPQTAPGPQPGEEPKEPK